MTDIPIPGRCRDCHHWAKMTERLGECILSEEGPEVSLHNAKVYRRDPNNPNLFGRTESAEFSGILETDADFYCISFDPRSER